MKLIGMLGGMSWESTAQYYRLANELVAERLGGLSSARMVLHSVDFAQIEALQVTGDWEAAGALLADAARGLERAGAELMILCTNTMHLVADPIRDALNIPFLHIADVTADAVRAAGVRRVGLLGTAYTMEQPFLRERLEDHGLQVVVPAAEDRAEAHRIIFDELCRGVIDETSRQTYRDIIARLSEDGAQGVILGCTEIELLVRPEDSPVPVFPTTALHVAAAVDAALA